MSILHGFIPRTEGPVMFDLYIRSFQTSRYQAGQQGYSRKLHIISNRCMAH